MTVRPLVAVTRDLQLIVELSHLDQPVLLADDLTGLPALFDEALLEYGADPIVAFGSDTAAHWNDPSPPFEAVLLYRDAGDVDWESLFWLAPAYFLHLPYDMPMLVTLLTRGEVRAPQDPPATP